MARLLFTVWPYPTHLHPFLAVALEARAQGHQVAFYTGGGALPILACEGFPAFPFHEVDWNRVEQTVDDLIAGRKRPSQMRRLWPRFLLETVPGQLHDIKSVLAEWPADAVVCDIAMWAPILLRERIGAPVVAFSHVANCILPGPEGPTQGIALPRRRTGLTGLYANIISAAVTLVTARTRRRANALRRQFGLSPLPSGVNEFTGTLPLYLVPSTPEFDNLRRDLPPSVKYVGPCLWEKHTGEPAPAWLGELRSEWKVVVVDEGALFTHEPRLLRLAVRGLADQPVRVILLAGEGRNLANLDLGSLPGNVTLHAHAPLSDVLQVADVLLTNGNSESVLAALLLGLPCVVLPSIWDQAEMAWRIAETGAGLRVSPIFPTPRHVRQAVKRVLEEPSFRDKARKMGIDLSRRGGPGQAASLIAGVASLEPGLTSRR